MIPSKFDYIKASSVDEALSLLSQHGSDAKLLAGGHSLIPTMKLRLSSPSALIDISKLEELNYISDNGDSVSIGAGTTHYQIASSDVIGAKIPFLAQAAGQIGDVQVRNMGTIGGSVSHADPAADYPASLLAGEAEIVIKSSSGERSIAAADFFTGLFATALSEGEIITEVKFPVPPDGSGSAYLKFMQPASRYALVGCAAIVSQSNGVCDRVRVAFTGVSQSAFRDTGVEDALTGKSPDADNIAAAAQVAADGKGILTDQFATQEYRQHLAKVYAQRALSAAVG